GKVVRVGPEWTPTSRNRDVTMRTHDGHEPVGILRLREDGWRSPRAHQIYECRPARHEVRPFADEALELPRGDARGLEEAALQLRLREAGPGERLRKDGAQDQERLLRA